MKNFSEIDVVILAGGLGTRLQSVNPDTQKVMFNVHGKPFLDLIIRHTVKQGLQRIIICTGFKSDQVKKYYEQNNFGGTIHFSNEVEPLGTGGALKNAREKIKSDQFICLNGDSFCPIDYRSLLSFHNKKNAIASLVITESKETEDYGGIMVDDGERILNFKEKQKKGSLFISAGIYCFDKEIFQLMPAENKFSLEYDLFPGLTGKGLYAFLSKAPFYDIGTPERYRQAEKFLERN